VQHPRHVAFRGERADDDEIEFVTLQCSIELGRASALVREKAEVLEGFGEERSNVGLVVDDADARRHAAAAEQQRLGGVERCVFHFSSPECGPDNCRAALRRGEVEVAASHGASL